MRTVVVIGLVLVALLLLPVVLVVVRRIRETAFAAHRFQRTWPRGCEQTVV